jgi:PAS domain S-box-containing protein
MRIVLRSFAFRYGCAAASVAAATWMRLLLDPWVGDRFPYATVFFAVLVTAWVGGLRPALAAAVLGGAAANYWLIPPRGRFGIEGVQEFVGLALYGGTSLGIALIGGAMHAARRRAEDKAQGAEDRFRLLVEGAGDYAIYMLDPAGRITSWNSGAERIKGYTAGEILGRHFSCFYTAEDVAGGKPERELRIALATGRDEEEGWRVRKDGSLFWASVTVTPLRDPAGRHLGFAKITRDRTEKKKAEDLVRESEHRLTSIYNTIEDVIFQLAVEPNGVFRFVSVNDAFIKSTGVPVEQVVGKRVDEVIPPPSAAVVLARYREAIESRKIVRWRETSDYPTGRRTGDVSIAPIFGTAGNCTHLVGTVHDVTQQLALLSETAAKEEAEHRFNRLLELAPTGLLVSNGHGKIVFINAQALRWFGYRREELVGQSVDMLVPHRVRAIHPRHRAGYLGWPVNRPMGTGRELFGLRKDGSEFPVEIGLSPARTGEDLQIIASIVDITERRRAEDELKRANQAFEAVNKELEAFAYSVSHDLQAPIRGMVGFSQMLIEDFGPQLPQEAQNHLRVIQDEGKRMGQLIDDMLSLSRVTRAEPRRERVNLSRIAAAVLATLRKAEPERKVECVVADGLEATCDAQLLRVLLDNLLGNAWKFTGHTAQPRIEFGAVSSDKGLAFFVRDNGAGFDMAYADKLFSAFQRLHTSSEFPGTGVGLATVQRIVARHGGRVWAEGVKGEGATFYFLL